MKRYEGCSCGFPCSESPLLRGQGRVSIEVGCHDAQEVPLQNFADDWQNRYWSIVRRIFSVTRLWDWDHTSKLPVSGNLTGFDREIEKFGEAGGYRMCSVF